MIIAGIVIFLMVAVWIAALIKDNTPEKQAERRRMRTQMYYPGAQKDQTDSKPETKEKN